ncbi:MAG TPA: radical SAM family heme chaperone HemW [Candidatus Polarisedimenticolia bacterium]|nr:radical SAM family heme chaperone HemW [Candidatus Polarisedimenticolia bacterium]
MSGGTLGLYVHVPYCTVRCSYCDFYLIPTHGRAVGPGRAPEAYIAALRGEIETIGTPLRGRAADTLHFGGGTPSLLPSHLLGQVIEALRAAFSLQSGSEIALEANPEDVDPPRLEALARLGVTRLTVGVQSLDDRRLGLLGRPHDASRALAALAAARAAGPRSLGADLILGLPGQEIPEALDGIRRVVDAGVDHLSLYILELHDRTRLGREAALGRLAPMADDAVAALYEAACDLLSECGFEHYEISNFARPGHRSRHNIKYWSDAEYVGFGPSAHSYLSGRRYANASDLDAYIARRGIGIDRIDDPQPPAGRAAEALFAGLRLTEGVDLEALGRRYGPGPPATAGLGLPQADGPEIGELLAAGLLERRGERLCLTRRGRLVSNEVFERLLPAGLS